jgi:hypothetical protein
MNIKRKIRFSAAGVIVSGAIALGTLETDPALATTCPDQGTCLAGTLPGTCSSDQAGVCEEVAPPGCTYVNSTCTSTICLQPPPFPRWGAICHYQPS